MDNDDFERVRAGAIALSRTEGSFRRHYRECLYDEWKKNSRWRGEIFILTIERRHVKFSLKSLHRYNLEHIIFEVGSSMKKIRENCFRFMRKLISINVPPDVHSIGPYAFAHCSSLRLIRIPQQLRTLQEGVFCGCTSLPKTISIPSRVLCIEKRAFYGCQSLEKIIIGSPVININKTAFHNCGFLLEIEVSKMTKCVIVSSLRVDDDPDSPPDEMQFLGLDPRNLQGEVIGSSIGDGSPSINIYKYMLNKFGVAQNDRMSIYRWQRADCHWHKVLMDMIGVDHHEVFPPPDNDELEHKRIVTFVDWGQISRSVFEETNRYPLHVAAENGFLVDDGLRSIFESFMMAVEIVDPVTGLEVFMLATRLESVYYLLRQYPQAISNHI